MIMRGTASLQQSQLLGLSLMRGTVTITISILNSNELDKVEDSDDFKFQEKKDKLFESETMKNLFNTFDCRVLDIEKDK